MLESERLAYLSALGITQYVALEPIAGAAELPELAPDQIWSEVASSAPLADAPSDQAASSEPAEPSVADVSTVKAEPGTPSADLAVPGNQVTDAVPQLDLNKLKLESEPVAKTVAKSPVRAERFALAVITIPDQFRLFVELAQPDAPGLSAVEHRMVADLLRALGCADGLDQHGAKLYRWPLVNNPRIAADPQAARDGLLGFVASAPAVAKSVFLGRRAAAVLGSAAVGEVFSLNAESGDALTSHSLMAMQSDWQMKAEAWNHLLAFLKPMLTPQP
ncbi:MAG: hypothetical protein CMK89_14775 [Pseudomonadales bacterium]|nr:hypothetical protein [Pseudomonadales bacterium]